jgi:hypothetical protein
MMDGSLHDINADTGRSLTHDVDVVTGELLHVRIWKLQAYLG